MKKFYMFFLFLILVGCGGNNEIENGESPDDPYISIDEIVEDVVLGGRMYAGQTVKINGLVEIEADLSFSLFSKLQSLDWRCRKWKVMLI
ncbi:hypothetical protein F4X10_00015 [Candidatus Poribacteria bacterium]|nr:hypothetical protein [Candidatus Poribacteria bacterium]